VSSSGTNVDVWDVNEQLKALIRSRRAVDAVMLVDPDAPLESLVAEEEPSDAR
jgi:3-phenylpropionate/trans-cinnamate dioxygenase ferredoxin reductase subunit